MRTPEMFERFLPFAMAFKIERQWAKAFRDIYREPPTWYAGSNVGSFDMGRFSESPCRPLESHGEHDVLIATEFRGFGLRRGRLLGRRGRGGRRRRVLRGNGERGTGEQGAGNRERENGQKGTEYRVPSTTTLSRPPEQDSWYRCWIRGGCTRYSVLSATSACPPHPPVLPFPVPRSPFPVRPVRPSAPSTPSACPPRPPVRRPPVRLKRPHPLPRLPLQGGGQRVRPGGS